MIKLKIKNIEKVLDLEKEVTFIIIENLKFFFDLFHSLTAYEFNEYFSFYNEKFETINLTSKIAVVSDYGNLDLSNSKIFLDFLKKNKLSSNLTIKERLLELYTNCIGLFEELAIESPVTIEMNDEINLDYLIKALNIRFSSSLDAIENIIKYCKILYEIYSKEVICFINLNNYFSMKDIEKIILELRMYGIKVLPISTNDFNIKDIGNTLIYIDDDLCEFYNIQLQS